MNKSIIKTFSGILALGAVLIFSGCYSVFNGGTGGLIVDAESTTTPKRGIPNVDVYAYTTPHIRDAEYKYWTEGTVFSPSDSYYGHTTTDANGNFVISNIVWEENNPDFGKDADYTTIYLLYYHENYGLTKGQTVITSDSTSDTVYAELTAIRKTTALNINIFDVANSNLTSNNIMVKVSVPQRTDNRDLPPKVYEQIINGSGIINITYPRWMNAADKADGIENHPEISISYFQSADIITWKACANQDNADSNYAFLDDGESITKEIRNGSYNISLYGKACRISLPSVSGTHGSSEAADGVILSMRAKDADGNYSIDCGETTTYSQTTGNSQSLTHGHFNGLGNGYFITDDQYSGKYKTIEVQFYANGSLIAGSQRSLRSDVPSYNLSF